MRRDRIGDFFVAEAWSDSLARLPAAFHADRDELLGMMRKDAILYESPTQPILSRDGSTARWMLNSLQVTLTPRGAELAGRCVLELLKRFEGRQIATLGLTAVPILNSVIMQSGGRYHGLLVRQQRKKHGSLKLIEGPIDKDEPTIVIDDSISSGTSMQLACDTLRAAGIRVEGGIFLVRFGWHGGFARMQEQGYHVEAVTDIWSDFIYHMDDEPKPIGNPTKIFPQIRWSKARAPEKLHPAKLARIAMREYLTSGKLPRPPQALDSDYPAGGGAWVSLRSLQDIHVRHARDGYWNFPGEKAWPASEAVLWAALKTAETLPKNKALALLDDSAIAVTFFTAMEQCPVGALDNDRYGIVVRSLERPGWMGGALPRMPGILNEWDQYQHARTTNAGLISFEPHAILRHDVIKAAEPGVSWQPTGVPFAAAHPLTRADRGGMVAARARDLAVARLFGSELCTAPLRDDLLPSDTDQLYVSVYLGGRLRGCFGAVLRRLDEDVATLVEAALGDTRFEAPADVTSPEAVSVTVALLYDRLELGLHSIEDIIRRIRYGEHALMVEQKKRFALYLPSVASRYSLYPVAFVEELLRKAAITKPPYRWTRFACAAWLADQAGERPVEGSFAPEAAPAGLPALLGRLAPLAIAYLLRHQRPDGTFFTRYEPLLDQLYESVDLPRLAHAAWVLARASGTTDESAGKAALRTMKFLLDAVEETADGLWLSYADNDRSVAENALLVLALCKISDQKLRKRWVPRLAATLWSRIDAHGRVHTHADQAAASDAYQDYFPGQVLLALATAAQAGLTSLDDVKFTRAFRYYRHRFRARPHFGQVSWLAQACLACWRIKPDPCFADLAFDVADWILGFQQQKSGAFLNDHQSDTPGYTTALYLEGLAAAACLARLTGNQERHRDYIDSCRRGLQFLDGLIIQSRDASLLPNPAMAIGGLRRSARASEICIDFVQHYLAALIGIREAAEAG
ncbi:AMMECR1 domain-containing protein [Bradyrhizobium sp.]|jgi:orotate phosphoribosyltransferase|uniref:AMMECR1 domain-containing protein n=1 Tax=Bradyrhizobium sp. TaxID=376 RepID=UPI002DFF389C|nr:AMMECR1 domain-containing protein [Bradyrhizobium sp.]